MPTSLPSGVAALSPSEKLQLVEDLWDELAESGVELPLTAGQRKLLRTERKAIRKNPGEGSTWPEARARILGEK
jgi:putative addiction module component (TIGR02574 family)